jgi:predicted short-subunit dehydrogenase-like oxidoreductase (DUF2520 family)
MKTSRCSLNIIGCGKLGRTLGRLWHVTGIFSVLDVVAVTERSALEAVNFIGAGNPQVSIEAIRQADLIAITTPDDSIPGVVASLLAGGKIGNGSVVFHASGALNSEVLADLREVGVSIASVHPVKSFSDPSEAVSTFAGTYCGIEGDEAAVALLSSAFEALGAKMFSVKADSKVFYHVAFVFACNYLTALMECAFQCCEAAGIERADVAKMIEPLVRETTTAVISRGVESALTGPVARGDAQVIAEQLSKLGEWRSDYAEIYQRLGQVALEIAERGGGLKGVALDQTREALAKR